MQEMNYLSIVVAAVAAFVASVVWYAVFGRAMAGLTAILIRVDPAANGSQRGRTNLPHLQA
jgi:hypothetical protein